MERKIGLAYNQNHARKIIYNGGGAGKIGAADFDQYIIGEALCGTVYDIGRIIPQYKEKVIWFQTREVVLPHDLLGECARIHEYFHAHRPLSAIAIGMIWIIRMMDYTGLHDAETYCLFMDNLRGSEIRDYDDFTEFVLTFQRHLKEGG